ncbi:RNA-guided endonuclease InsQ/TnpB family protein [Sedimenticola hydrogenitrophicus]|uniref:RNA-guided endonuclease InsQ/TnpB family protein n=1 Tax=Sedimenticola hydrogenitrophicus TaxID=2967975 RepID=UPI0021A8E593|nr:transposase [Sedimenticola hydrogenitrophicus]
MRTYKLLCLPTVKQCKRLEVEYQQAHNVHNWALGFRQQAYRKWGLSLDYRDLSAVLTTIKKTTKPWLAEASAGVLVQRLLDQDKAFKNFFEGRAQYPKFRPRRRSKNKVRYQLDQRHIDKTFIPGERLVIPRLGSLRVRWSRVPEGRPKMVTVEKDPTGRYWISFMVDEPVETLARAKYDSTGVDLGIKSCAVDSRGNEVLNPKPLYHNLYRLKILQRRLKHKQKGSRRKALLRKRIAKLHQKIAHQRQTFLHQLSFRLIHENQVVCAETLKVKNLLRNRRLSRADVGMGELLRQLAYKSEWYGRTFVQIDQWYASSKTCSCCGHKLDKLDLSTREWDCPACGTHHDRDHNAALNIEAEGLALLSGVPRIFGLIADPAELIPAANDVEFDIHRSSRPLGQQRPAGFEASTQLASA